MVEGAAAAPAAAMGRIRFEGPLHLQIEGFRRICDNCSALGRRVLRLGRGASVSKPTRLPAVGIRKRAYS